MEIVGENRPPIHPNSMVPGQNSFVPMQQMHGIMHQHSSGMPMPMSSSMVDLPNKQAPVHMGVAPPRPTHERKIRGQTAATAAGPSKRPPRPRAATARSATIQPQAPTMPNVYQPQTAATSHSMYPQGNYPWTQQQGIPGAQQQTMMPTYPNTQQMKPQHVMQTVRPAGVPGRSNVQYTNQPMQQQPQQQPVPQQQQQPQPQQGQTTSQMSVGYMNDPTSMMMASQGTNSIPANVNRQTVAPNSVKRKLVDANLYSTEQAQYATPPKMTLQSTGKNINKYKSEYFILLSFHSSNATISTKSCDDATK